MVEQQKIDIAEESTIEKRETPGSTTEKKEKKSKIMQLE
jgi:hypothetical protein